MARWKGPVSQPNIKVLAPTPFAARLSSSMYEELGRLEMDLLGFSQRFGHLMNVFAAFEVTTRGKPFLIYHEPMWTMLIDERDMLFIDLASWAKGMHAKGGFLRTVVDRGELGALALPWGQELQQAGNEEWLRAHFERTNAASRRKAYERLFPIAQTETPTPSDVTHLCAYLRCSFDPLRLDRNQHRAHKYEKEKPVTAARLAPCDALEHFNQCRQLIADLRFLASNSSFTSYGYDVKAKADDEEAQDVVDLILCGSLGWIANYGMLANSDPADTYFWQKRDRCYERLHAAHDAAGDPAAPFNNRALVVDRLGLQPPRSNP
jgi:hypothetical protein